MATLNTAQQLIVKSVRTIMRAEDKVIKAEGEVSTRYTETANVLVAQADTKLDAVPRRAQLVKELKATLVLAKIDVSAKTNKRGANLLAELTRRVTVLLQPETDFMRVVPKKSGDISTPMLAADCKTVQDFKDANAQVRENLGFTKPAPKAKTGGAVKTDADIADIVALVTVDKLKCRALVTALRAAGFEITPPKDMLAAMTVTVSKVAAPRKRKSTKVAKAV